MPLLVGLDGTEKMSKSKGNYIAVEEKPHEMFGKVMSIPDALMENYWTLLTDRPVAEVQRLLREMHPREAKDLLARDIVTRYWSAEEAAAASDEFRRVFAEKEKPSDMHEVRLVGAAFPLPDHTIGLAELIVRAGFAKSNSEAMRLIKQGAVSLDDHKIDNPQAFVAVRSGQVLRVGKRRWARLAVK
jgi:tyrosyl-tRNA synthetase